MKITIVGTHGVGKTTLLNKLKEIFPQYKYYDEVAREVINSIGKPPHLMSIPELYEYETTLFNKQIEIEEESIGSDNIHVYDRGVYDILAYAHTMDSHLFFSFMKPCVSHTISSPYDYVFYIPIEFSMEDDGARKVDEGYRNSVDSNLRGLLKYSGLRVIECRGTIEERINTITNTINQCDIE